MAGYFYTGFRFSDLSGYLTDPDIVFGNFCRLAEKACVAYLKKEFDTKIAVLYADFSQFGEGLFGLREFLQLKVRLVQADIGF